MRDTSKLLDQITEVCEEMEARAVRLERVVQMLLLALLAQRQE